MSDLKKFLDEVKRTYEANILPDLKDYIKIKNVSSGYVEDQKENINLQDEVIDKAKLFVDKMKLEPSKYKLDILKDMNEETGARRTPLLLMDVEPNEKPGEESNRTFLIYGHLDK